MLHKHLCYVHRFLCEEAGKVALHEAVLALSCKHSPVLFPLPKPQASRNTAARLTAAAVRVKRFTVMTVAVVPPPMHILRQVVGDVRVERSHPPLLVVRAVLRGA